MPNDAILKLLEDNYKNSIEKIRNGETKTIYIDCDILKKYKIEFNNNSNESLYTLLERKPLETIETFEEIVDILIGGNNVTNTNKEYYIKFDYNGKETKLNDLLSDKIGSLIKTTGVVKGLYKIKPVMNVGVFECRGCMRIYEEKQKTTGSMTEPSLCNECGGRSFRLIKDESSYYNSRKILLEEPIEDLGNKTNPRNILVVLTGDGDFINKVNVGDDYSTRLQQMAEGLIDGFLLTCHREVEVLAHGAGAETQLALPHGINYIVGTNQLRITCNGVVWYEGYQYEELGHKFSRSSTINLLTNINPGDQICAWVVPLKGTYNQGTETFEPDESTVCNQVTWVNEELVSTSTEITIPEGFKYINGKKHLCVSLNGIVLTQNIDYLEIGEFKQEAYKLSFNFPLKVGDVLNVWTVPYNIGESQQVQDSILQLQNDIQYLKNSLIDESKVLDRIDALDNRVEQIILDGNSFKGAVTLASGLPVADYKKGDQYSVAEAGTYAGQLCEVGDLIICIRDFNEETFSDSDWNVLQANIESMKPATDEQIDAIIEGLI